MTTDRPVADVLNDPRLSGVSKFAILSRQTPRERHPWTCNGELADCRCSRPQGRHVTHKCRCGGEWSFSNDEHVVVTFPGGSHKPRTADHRPDQGAML